MIANKAPSPDQTSDAIRKERIIAAAFDIFMAQGYAGASTIEIATKARVSKRDLYRLFGNKRAILTSVIASRANRMVLPDTVPRAADSAMLRDILTQYGVTLLREATHPTVTAVFRLAILESGETNDVALELKQNGFDSTERILVAILTKAQEDRLLKAHDTVEMAGQFLALLWGNLHVRLLLRLIPQPSLAEIAGRASRAVDAFLHLYQAPNLPASAP